MLSFVIGILLMTRAFAGHKNIYGDYRITPANTDLLEDTDITSDIFDSNALTRQNSKFTYSFQQLRRDQPPQLELREGNLEKYMHNHPLTTEEIMPAVQEPINKQNEKMEVHGLFKAPITVPEKLDNHDNGPRLVTITLPATYKMQKDILQPQNRNDWNYQLAYPEKMPPSIPKWEDLREPLKHHSLSPKSIRQTVTYHHSHPQSSISASLATVLKQEHPVRSVSLPNAKLFPSNTLSDNDRLHSNSKQESFRRGHIGQLPQHNYRGKYKFGWNDVEKETTYRAMTTTTLATVNRGGKLPPPVPTLSPWYDGYGK